MLFLRLGPAEVRFTGRSEGDFSSAAGDARGERQRLIIDRPWKIGRQVHGTRAAVVDASTDVVGEADALVTRDRGVAIAVRTADCAPVVLAGDGVVAVAHAGWRGLHGGVLEETVRAMRALGATQIAAALGPCIRAECYEFGAELDAVAARLGDEVRGRTASGAPALDVAAGVRVALRRLGIDLDHDAAVCTACDCDGYWSYRARQESERQTTVAWLA